MQHTTQDILSLFNLWNEALQTCEPDNMLKLYAEDAILLPTLSNQVRHNHEEIRDYFVAFMKKKPFGEIKESNVRIFGDLAINSGVYTFQLTDDSGDRSEAWVRFTYAYRFQDGEWRIVEHHSSLMPEG